MSAFTLRSVAMDLTRGVGTWTRMAMRRRWAIALSTIALQGCASQEAGQVQTTRTRTPPNDAQWLENFSGALNWASPSGHGPDLLARVYRVENVGGARFLKARHDARGEDAPDAMHYGYGFEERAPLLDATPILQFRWRVRQHPSIGADAWVDLAASVYVVMKQPSLLSAGRGFKLGWVAKPAALGTRQRGLLQVPLRSDAASDTWRKERVDLCALYRQNFGPCEDARILYVGVVTDADGTKSVAAGDYADFSLTASP